jgi:hypothetical protein
LEKSRSEQEGQAQSRTVPEKTEGPGTQAISDKIDRDQGEERCASFRQTTAVEFRDDKVLGISRKRSFARQHPQAQENQA